MDATAGSPTRPPANIEDFLWNLHSVMVATPGPLHLDKLQDAYSNHLGHKCAIERFLFVGEGGLGATLKRIPHIVNIFQENGATCMKATQPADSTKQQLIESDKLYRRKLREKNQAAKAKAATTVGTNTSKAKAVGAGKAAPATAAGVPGVSADAAAASARQAAEAKRPAEGAASPGGNQAKRARGEVEASDADTLARMLVQGVVRVLRNRQNAGQGPLPVANLEDEFKALWSVPFNLQQAKETDAVTFLQKWPNRFEVYHDGTQHLVQLQKRVPGAAKAGDAPVAATGAAGPPAAFPGAAPRGAAAAGAAVAAKAGAAGARSPSKAPTAAKTIAAPGVLAAAKGGAGSKAPPVAAPGLPAKPPAPAPAAADAGAAFAPAKAPGPTVEAPSASKNGPATPKIASGPTRTPPASIEDCLFNIHTVVGSYGGPMPVDQLKDAYSKQLGHKCAIERFLVVGDGGLPATLKRIPHIVTVIEGKDGAPSTIKAALPAGTTKEGLVNADHQYRRQLQEKQRKHKQAGNAAAAAPAVRATPLATAPAAPAVAATSAPAAPAKAASLAGNASAAAAADGPASPTGKRPAEAGTEAAEGAQAAKKLRSAGTEDSEILAKMLVQGVRQVIQNRQKEGKGPLPLANVEAEFKALWKVPFNLSQVGETEVGEFLQKWPNRVELSTTDGERVVQLAGKATTKAKAVAGAPPAVKAPTPTSPPAKPPGPPAAGPAECFGFVSFTSADNATKATPPRAVESVGTPPAPAAPPGPLAPGSPEAVAAPTGAAALGRPSLPAAKERQTPVTRSDGVAKAPPAALPADVAELVRSLPDVREQAVGMLHSMAEMARRQQALLSTLERLSPGGPGGAGHPTNGKT